MNLFYAHALIRWLAITSNSMLHQKLRRDKAHAAVGCSDISQTTR